MRWQQINLSCQAEQEHDTNNKQTRKSLCRPVGRPQFTISIQKYACYNLYMQIYTKDVNVLLTRER